MKRKRDKLNVDKLVPIPVDLNKLSALVKIYVVKKDAYNAKIKDIEDKISDITNLATHTTPNDKINEAKNEIPSISNLVANASLNTKTNEVKIEIPSITSVATITPLTGLENEIPDHSKYITTPEFNKLKEDNVTAKLKQANFANKGDIAEICKK